MNNDISMITIELTQVAKLIRSALKVVYPATKFGVKSSRYSQGCSIRVEWTDGPTPAQVDAVVQPFAGSKFNGIDDSTTHNWLPVLTEQGFGNMRYGVDYVQTSRTVSFEHRLAMAHKIADELKLEVPEPKLDRWGQWHIGSDMFDDAKLDGTWGQAIYRRTCQTVY